MLQGRGACLCTMMHWAPLPMEFIMFLWHHCHRVVVFGASLQISVSHFHTFSCWSNFLSCVSVSMCGFGKNGHDTLCSSGHGTTSVTFYQKMLRRCCASMLFWVNFTCPVGDSSSCAMVVMCTGASAVFCSSDESPPTYIHSSTNTFYKVSPVGIQFTYNGPSETFFLFPGAPIATMFSQAPTRDSQDICCFSLVVVPSEDNCILSVPLSTSDLHKGVGKVAKIARWCPPGLSRCCATHSGFL